MRSLKTSLSLALAACSQLAIAAGDSGTGAVGEMNLSGGQFLLLVGGVAAVGIALWLVSKFISK